MRRTAQSLPNNELVKFDLDHGCTVIEITLYIHSVIDYIYRIEKKTEHYTTLQRLSIAIC